MRILRETNKAQGLGSVSARRWSSKWEDLSLSRANKEWGLSSSSVSRPNASKRGTCSRREQNWRSHSALSGKAVTKVNRNALLKIL